MSVQLEGVGTLLPADASVAPVPVNFSFDIRQEPRLSRPGLPPPLPRLHGPGDVRAGLRAE